MAPDLSLIAQLFDFYTLKDLASRYTHISDATAKLIGFRKADDCLGLDDRSISCPAVESAEAFMNQDQWVLRTQKKMLNLDIHHYADQLHILLTKKTPYFQGDALVGTFCGCTEWSSERMMRLCAALTELDRRYYPKQSRDRSYQISGLMVQDDLSPQEMHCLFHLLRSKSAKEIAKCLNLSHRTVEWHLANIRGKFQCTTKAEVIERAVSKGYLHYVPQHLLTTDFSQEI